jgi:CubicO group peptidase (beta-lactamase class C family)
MPPRWRRRPSRAWAREHNLPSSARETPLVYERGYGLANLELGVPIAPTSVFEAASISKQFTAMSLMLLVERGRLSLDDEVRKYLPEMPDYGSPLTIRHLLNHTSGLRDAFLILELSAPEDEYGDRNDVILKQLARQRSLNSKPGLGVCLQRACTPAKSSMSNGPLPNMAPRW